MTTFALLATLLTSPVLQPEPVVFDKQAIDQEIRVELQVQLQDVHQSLQNMEVGETIEIAKLEEPQKDSIQQ